MEVEQALEAFAAAEALYDGSKESLERVSRLTVQLIEQGPRGWWDSFHDAAQQDSPMRREAKRLIDTGIVDGSTTFRDLPAIVAEQQ